MDEQTVVEIATDAMLVGAKLAGPILIVSLVIGVIVSLFQAVTSIQEMTLTFVPKLAGTDVVIVVGEPWMLEVITTWVTQLWGSIPGLV
jgi:flagellar biosynthesis protein FliQ